MIRIERLNAPLSPCADWHNLDQKFHQAGEVSLRSRLDYAPGSQEWHAGLSAGDDHLHISWKTLFPPYAHRLIDETDLVMARQQVYLMAVMLDQGIHAERILPDTERGLRLQAA